MSTLDLPSGDFEISDLFSDDQIITITGETTLYDNVSKPAHYNLTDGIECIDYIKQVLGLQGFVAYCRGNVMKYNHRATYKNATPVEDLKKAQQYLEWANETLKEIHK
ncbi:MAG: hypothetical protein CMC70_01045 [Flavobacteriaceae bacterium]|nr:hypothetical protein [Flavobacteriaceae bacterium]|tara:strand:- start:9051 stop:9374 length:324 start_codon:yes stop_codon:yes gene_type:complete